MTHDDELAIVPRAHAKQIVYAARATDPRLEAVRANLRREAFLFPGPPQLMRFPTVCFNLGETRANCPSCTGCT